MFSVSDLFSELMPVAVHQAITAYDIRKTEIVNAEISRLRESTQILNRYFSFLEICGRVRYGLSFV